MTDVTLTDPLGQGATIGILGGGQLGRMLALAAARLGLRCHVYDPAPDAPAAQVSAAHTAASYEDAEALTRFGEAVDVITYEFENIPTTALDILSGLAPIRPGRRSLDISQDRLSEKSFLSSLGLSVAPFGNVPDSAALGASLDRIGYPAILKTRRFGYDGKGQVRIRSEDQAEPALESLNGAPAIVEGMVHFNCEISVIGARGVDGSVACYDPGENIHRDGILHTTTVPARLSGRQRTDAVLLTGQILSALNHVGVLAVELFVTRDGLVVNEIAPRVHNSGHWTQNGATICQFEQHIRAVAGWPLGNASRHADVEMRNLIGDDMDGVPEIAADGLSALHLYGKAEARAGRKMGHVNRILPAKS